MKGGIFVTKSELIVSGATVPNAEGSLFGPSMEEVEETALDRFASPGF